MRLARARNDGTLIPSWSRAGSAAACTPTLRIHGQRPATAIWQYGTAAEPVLATLLKLCYALVPYIYSLGRHTYESIAPMMRALFMECPNDPNVPT